MEDNSVQRQYYDTGLGARIIELGPRLKIIQLDLSKGNYTPLDFLRNWKRDGFIDAVERDISETCFVRGILGLASKIGDIFDIHLKEYDPADDVYR